jgi:hypothetical protein
METQSKNRVWSARAGLIMGAAAWLIDQQLTSNLTYARCDVAHPAVVLTIGAVCAALAAVGCVLSWRAMRTTDGTPMSSFTAYLGMLASAYAILVVIAGTAAGLILPGCFR